MLMGASVQRASHHEGDGEVVQSRGRVVVRQVGVQVPWRERGHGLDAELPVDTRQWVIRSNQINP